MKENKLPPGWIWASLAEIALVNPSTDLSEITDDTELSFVPMAAVEAETGKLDSSQIRQYSELKRKSLTKFQEGDILFAKITPCMENGKIAVASALASGRGLGSTEFHVIRPIRGISTRYLLNFLLQKSVRVEAERNMTGAVGQRRVPTGYLRELRVPLPPLAEQERIVDDLEDYLSRLENSVSTTSAIRFKLDRFAESIYRQALDGGFSRPVDAEKAFSIDHVSAVNSSFRTRRSKTFELDSIPDYSLPENWLLVSMGDLAYASGYGTSVKCEYGAVGSPVLRIPNVQGGVLDLNDMKSAVDDSIDLSGYFVSPGDALFVRTNGSRNLIGRVGIVEKELHCAFASYLVRFRFSLDLVEPRWIQVVTQSPAWRARIEQLAASSAGQFNLNIQSLSGLPIPLPPLQIQRDILAKVDEYCSISSQMSTQLREVETRAARLRESILRQAFSGKLVHQNSSEESASILLERIRAERASQAKPRRKRVGKKTSTTGTRPAPSISSDPAGTFVQEELGL